MNGGILTQHKKTLQSQLPPSSMGAMGAAAARASVAMRNLVPVPQEAVALPCCSAAHGREYLSVGGGHWEWAVRPELANFKETRTNQFLPGSWRTSISLLHVLS